MSNMKNNIIQLKCVIAERSFHNCNQNQWQKNKKNKKQKEN